MTIDNQYNSYASQERHTSEQSSIGITVGLGGKVGSAVKGASNLADRVEQIQEAKSDRAEALYGIAAAREAYDLGKDLKELADPVKGGLKGNTGVSVSIGYNHSESESSSQFQATEVVGSHLSSGGDTVIVARGENDGREGTGNLNIVGSAVEAGGSVILAANNDINLVSAEEVYHSVNSNSSSSTGVSVGIDIGAGLGFNASVSGSKSQGGGNMDTVTHVETVIKAGDTVEFASVNDTTLKGAQIIADTVMVSRI